MIQILQYSPDGKSHTDLQPNDLPAALKDIKKLVWIDFVEEPIENCETIFRDIFHFHPLAIEDALHDLHTPKVDDWRSYLYLALHGLQIGPDENNLLRTDELDIFLGRNYLVTYQQHAIPSLNRLWQSCLKDDRILKRGASFLLYRVAEEIVSTYQPFLDRVEDTIDEIEDEIFDQPTPANSRKNFPTQAILAPAAAGARPATRRHPKTRARSLSGGQPRLPGVLPGCTRSPHPNERTQRDPARVGK